MALHGRAARRREEIAAKRDDFELTKAKIVFAIQLVVFVAALAAVPIVLTANPELIPTTLIVGGILRGVLGVGRNAR